FDLEERRRAGAAQGHAHAIRDASVEELQRRFNVDAGQAAHVARIAARLYSEVQPGAGAEARGELRWAGALHEVGMMVSHHDHHRHSAYVLAHVDAAGFSQSQLRRIAELVLSQRGGLRKLEPQLASEDYAWQVLCLRIAVICCHARSDIDTSALKIRRHGTEAVLDCPAGWLDAHPRTLHLLRDEVDSWARNGPLKLQLGGADAAGRIADPVPRGD
ncbi:MAG: HD domain-containing protein, partial [Caldimonas sp.]